MVSMDIALVEVYIEIESTTYYIKHQRRIFTESMDEVIWFSTFIFISLGGDF